MNVITGYFSTFKVIKASWLGQCYVKVKPILHKNVYYLCTIAIPKTKEINIVVIELLQKG